MKHKRSGHSLRTLYIRFLAGIREIAHGGICLCSKKIVFVGMNYCYKVDWELALRLLKSVYSLYLFSVLFSVASPHFEDSAGC